MISIVAKVHLDYKNGRVLENFIVDKNLSTEVKKSQGNFN